PYDLFTEIFRQRTECVRGFLIQTKQVELMRTFQGRKLLHKTQFVGLDAAPLLPRNHWKNPDLHPPSTSVEIKFP
ncbi:MAG: hypothetical protein KDA99_28155, partial [Planctomycetales bacterium]|nr:hypothetical protein [Planctomycetales bacterium]